MQDVIPHYTHRDAFHPKILACVVGIFCLADPQKYIGIYALEYDGIEGTTRIFS